MGRKGVTYEAVATVADEMIAVGTPPTTSGIRERIGGGSYTTIGAHLAKWRDTRAEVTAPDILTALPNEVARAVTVFINGQVNAVKTAAEVALAAERTAGAASESTADQLAQDLEAAQAQIANLEIQVAEAAGRVKQANDSGKELDGKLAAVERRAAESEKIAAVAEARVEAAERRALEAAARELEARDALREARAASKVAASAPR